MSRRLLIVLCCIAALAAVAPAAADGPPPGISSDGYGIASPNGELRYLALDTGRKTIVEAVNTRDGSLATYETLRGEFGIPAIGWHATGMSPDGKTLVVTTFPWIQTSATFVVFRLPYLDKKHVITLKGAWSYDAMSPDGRLLYLIQSLTAHGAQRYLVRAYDLRFNRLLNRVIADRRDVDGPMTGSAVIRATSRSGAWAYTLYTRPDGSAFVHALDTVHLEAVCIDLPWKDVTLWAQDARLWLSRDGATLHVRQRGAGGRWALISTRTWKLKVSSTL